MNFLEKHFDEHQNIINLTKVYCMKDVISAGKLLVDVLQKKVELFFGAETVEVQRIANILPLSWSVDLRVTGDHSVL